MSEDLKQWSPLLDNKYLVKINGKNVLFNQEEINIDIYIVKSGRVRLSYFTSDGAEKIFMFAMPGSMFGEATCFEPEAQFFHAATIVNCELYKIPMDQFLDHLSKDTKLNSYVLTSMSHKIHITVEQVMRLSFLDARSRVAAVFVDLAKVFGIKENDGSIRINLPVIQQGIANLVKTSRLTVGKTIRDFETEGLIEKRTIDFLYISWMNL